MAEKLFLELVSPEKLLVSAEVDTVFATGSCGAFGLYPDHSPFVTVLVPCVLTYSIGQETFKFVVSKGFLEVANNKVNVITEKALNVKDLNKDSIKHEIDAIKEILSKDISDAEKSDKEVELQFYETALSL